MHRSYAIAALVFLATLSAPAPAATSIGSAKIDTSIDLTSVQCTGANADLFFSPTKGVEQTRLPSMTELLQSLDGHSDLEKIYSFAPLSDVFVRKDGQMLMVASRRNSGSPSIDGQVALIKFEISAFRGTASLMETADHPVTIDVAHRTLSTTTATPFTCTW